MVANVWDQLMFQLLQLALLKLGVQSNRQTKSALATNIFLSVLFRVTKIVNRKQIKSLIVFLLHRTARKSDL